MSEALLWNELGNVYLKIGSPEEAIAAFTKAIELNPDSGWLYCNLGHAYLLMGEFGHALSLFRKSIQLMDTPENQATVWNKIGDAYRALKDIDNAILAYKKADDLGMQTLLSEQDGGIQPANLANTRKMTRKEKNIQNTNSLLSAFPKRAEYSEPSIEIQALADGFQPINVEKGNEEIHLAPNQPETEPPVLPEPSKITNQDNIAALVDNHQDISHLVREAKNVTLPGEKPFIAVPNSNEMAENLPNEGTFQYEPKQIRDIATVIREDEVADKKIKGHSNIHPGIDNLEEILAKVSIYENITRVNPTNDRAWDTLGKLYKSLGRYQDAIGVYQKAIEMAPDREVYYYFLGLLYSVEQQHDDAVQAFQVVLRKNPDYILAHSAIAGVYHRMGLENKANHHIAIALPKMSKEDAYNRACFYAICGDTELAVEFLRLALMNKDTTIEWIKSDPDLDPIRTDQRYQELVSGKDQPDPENVNENHFSSELEGTHNRLLPVLNHSLVR